MQRCVLSLALLSLVACSANGQTSSIPQQPNVSQQSIPDRLSPQVTAVDNGVAFTVYGPTAAFKATRGENGIAYDGSGGLWISSPTAFEHHNGSAAYTINNGFSPTSANDGDHVVQFIVSLNGYVYGFGHDGESMPAFVRLSSNGSRSIFHISGIGSTESVWNFAAGANAIYLVTDDPSGTWRLYRISPTGVVLNVTTLHRNDSSGEFVSLAVQPTTGEAYVIEQDQDYYSSTLQRYSASGTLENTYQYQFRANQIPSYANIGWTTMAWGSDGNLYIPSTDLGRNTIIAVFRPSEGGIAGYATPTSNAGALNPVEGADGNIWFVENYANKIVRMDPQGRMTEFPSQLPNPLFIAAAPRGATENSNTIWFTSETDYHDSVRAAF